MTSKISQVIAASTLVFAWQLMPNEILSAIFVHLCFQSDPFSRRFGDARCTIALVSRHWLNVCYSVPSLWRMIVIDPDSTLSGISNFVHNSLEHPIMVSFSLLSDSTPEPQTESSFLACVTALLKTAYRWSDLSIRVDNFDVIRAIFDLLAAEPVLLVRYLSVSARAFNPAPHATLFSTGIPFMQGSLASLQCVRMQGIPLPWLLSNPLPSLVSLTLHDLPYFSWPSYMEFISLVKSSHSLRHLSISSMGLRDVPEPVAPTKIPQLETLSINLGVLNSAFVCSALRCLDFPTLSFLRIIVRSPIGLRTFVRSSLTFEARQFRLCDSRAHDDTPSLYAKISGVQSLDLQRCDVSKVASLRSTLQEMPGSVVFPSLTHLSLPCPNWLSLASVLVARKALGAPVLKLLRCHLPSPLTDTSMHKLSPWVTSPAPWLTFPAPSISVMSAACLKLYNMKAQTLS
ncbi:hypothetical protein DFH06DRAFT_1150907 [Mycena polygramma]|nr:hypothetical protein DFH06DRAFT_1150907 [Mycena polygramma]